MKTIRVVFSFFLIFFPVYLFSQPTENIDEILRKYTISVERPTSARAILHLLKLDLGRLGPEAIGLSNSDAKGINQILNLNRVEVERKAIEPFYLEMCSELGSDTPDIEYVASLFIQATEAEELAVENSINNLSSYMTEIGAESFERELSKRSELKTYKVVDWVGIASDRPSIVNTIFSNACENFFAPEDNIIGSDIQDMKDFGVDGASINVE